MAKGGKKDAKCIAGLLKSLISQIEQTHDPNNQKTDHRGVVDLALFDGASNVQNAGKLVSITYPCITVVHGAEHVVSLFFKDIFTKMPVFHCLSQFLKRCRNIFGSTCYGPHAIFKKHSIMHNNCIYVGSRLGNLFGIPRNSAEFCDYSDFGPFGLRNFHWNFIFPIVKCVPTNSELVFSGSESSPAIDCSSFMNRKTFPL
jgi:hypothetical protein